MDQQRNLIVAIALSIAILLGFEYFFGQRQPHPPAPTTQTAPAQPSATAPVASGPAGAAAAVKPREEVLGEAQRVAIDTPRLKGSISLLGARVDDLTLADYHETIDRESPPIVLLSPDGAEHPYYVDFGWVAAGGSSVKLPDETTRWKASEGALTTRHPIDLTWDNGAGLQFIRHYAVDDNYMFTVTQTVKNSGDQPVTVYPYSRVVRVDNVPQGATYILHEGPIAVLNGTLHDGGWWAAPDKYNYADVKKAPLTDESTGGWLGFTDKYWLTALIPAQQEPVKTQVSYSATGDREIYQANYRGSEHTVPAHGSSDSEGRFFAGAKEVHLLDSYEETLAIPKFDRAIDFGLFYWITKPIFLALDFIYQRIGNFGLAILLLTVVIKLIFFPLANKSYRAMSKMKLLQPEMEKLRERFGEDKARLQQEMMALYKRVGANPMAGCLPIVIQIPVFFSLYKVLYVTIEMRHAPFFGWIHDLSAPDPTTFVNLFGLLPFTLPPALAFLHIGAWPLLMGITMFLQQKLNPQPADPVQAKMFMVLPVVFTYMLAQFPAGLVIYWAWNNLLSIAQQWLIMRRAGTRVPAKVPTKA
jgi:YidC/Oxa1 family membrane protein insertase